ncbi:MAG: MBL fold metallo-hydrolase [Clostridia bacterium]|jgi:L-ascorbate metabolism protein UlaG (beta-lactamase superfamily)|nr:MBL fold metallo-hydrolase [Clostridia bacterium]MCI2000218.1 MBL fold metallo-hydrolase [Clostridia bacterium]MCI2014617.1 MBL fold metallo-hydrolase [Clostridia bacterium]
MSKLLYQGHGSYRIETNKGIIIYVDPFAGTGYDKKADIVLITHHHYDHDNISLITQNAECTVIGPEDALNGVKYNSFDTHGIRIDSVSAYNKNHDKHECVGYVLLFDGIKLYASGDTSLTEDMKDMSYMHIDYALLPIDGIYNMNVKEAIKCAEIINAKHTIPVHMKPGELFDINLAEKFMTPSALIVEAGKEITLQ